MAQERKRIVAACLCGAARHGFILSKDQLPVHAAFCNCNSCRHMSGCLCVSSIPIISKDQYQPSRSFLDKLQPFEFSRNQIYHYFCPVCGSHMVAHVLPRAQNHFQGRWFVMCGTILGGDVTRLYSPRHEYVADTVDGGLADLLTTAHGLSIERWDDHPGNGQQRPLGPSPYSTTSIPPSQEQHLSAHCKCRGVEFTVSRQTGRGKYSVKFCSCSSCRLSTGMDGRAIASAIVPVGQVLLQGGIPFQEGQACGTLKKYGSGSSQTRWFCGSCGAAVFVTTHDSTVIFVAVGLFAATEGARADSWLEWPGLPPEEISQHEQCALAPAPGLTH